jgi:hypothetical protein
MVSIDISLITIPVFIGIWAAVFVQLQEPGEIFSFWPGMRNKLIGLTENRDYFKNPTKPWEETLLRWFGYCAKCHAGFVSLVAFPLLFTWDPFNHFAFVVLAIFVGWKAGPEEE